MHSLKRLFFGLVLCCIGGLGYAQTFDCGAVLSLDYQKKIIHGLSFTVGAEGRFDQKFTSFDRFKLAGSFHYTFWKKHFKAGVFGYYMLSNQHSFFENRGRIGGDFSFSQDIRNFSLEYRIRAQSTFFEEKHANHKFNPKTYLRNRLHLEYSFFSKPIKLYASTEFFLRLYKKDDYFVDSFRTILGMSYRFDKQNSINIYVRADNEIQVKNPAHVFYLGIDYKFKH